MLKSGETWMYTSLGHDTQMICSNFCLLTVCLTYYFLAENTHNLLLQNTLPKHFYLSRENNIYFSAFSKAWGWINLWNSTLVWKVAATEPWPDILILMNGEKQSDVVYTRAGWQQILPRYISREYAWLQPCFHYPHFGWYSDCSDTLYTFVGHVRPSYQPIYPNRIISKSLNSLISFNWTPKHDIVFRKCPTFGLKCWFWYVHKCRSTKSDKNLKEGIAGSSVLV